MNEELVKLAEQLLEYQKNGGQVRLSSGDSEAPPSEVIRAVALIAAALIRPVDGDATLRVAEKFRKYLENGK